MKRLIVLIGLIIILIAALYTRPVPEVTATSIPVQTSVSKAIALPWPAAGQAALGAKGYGLLANHGVSTPLPVASVAKVITATAILQKKPVTPGSQGPVITLTQSDVDLFNKYYLNDGSVIQVQAGEQITEYQALQAMLLPSANNLADTLATWAFGSLDAYITYANGMVRSLGMVNTTVGDATGFNDYTFSTASDIVKLGLAAMNNSTIAAITAQQSATLPVAGSVNNTNWLLGQDGVVGIKTGNTDKAGGCYLFAAQRPVLGRQVTLVGAILDDSDLNDAIHQADSIVKASDAGFELVTPVQKGQTVGNYQAPWKAAASIKSEDKISLLAWKGQAVRISSLLPAVKSPLSAGSFVGTITITSGQQSASTRAVLANNLSSPTWTWRIFHR